MPLYEFVCLNCRHRFEVLRVFGHADDDVSCPTCQGQEVRRLISSFFSVSKGADGTTTSLGGNACSSCAASSCATCGV